MDKKKKKNPTNVPFSLLTSQNIFNANTHLVFTDGQIKHPLEKQYWHKLQVSFNHRSHLFL